MTFSEAYKVTNIMHRMVLVWPESGKVYKTDTGTGYLAQYPAQHLEISSKIYNTTA
jgi:hypothetical protein